MPDDDPASRIGFAYTTKDGILDLPPEITAQIFVHCLPLDLNSPSLLTAPLLLGQICTQWRTIAWQTPDLWTALKVDSARIPITLVEAWLGRTGTLPLSLAIAIWQEHECDYCKAVIAVFKRYSSTWRKIALEIPWEAFEFLAAESPLDLPLLDSLAIWTEELDELPGAALPWRAFRDAHALRKLSVIDTVNPNALELPWTQLTSFECHDSGGMDSHDFLTILKHTPNLVECDTALFHYGHNTRPLPDVPPLTSLTSLALQMSDEEDMDTFSHITLPALQILDLSRVLFSGLVERLRPFLSNPDCRIRELIIRINERPEVEDFMQLLEAQPSLEKFDFREGYLGLLIALCRRLCDGSAFLPRLSCLCASPCIYPVSEITEVFPVMLDALDDALHARNMLSSDCFVKIQKCVIKDWTGSRTDDLDTIVERFRPRQRELIALGIDLVVGDE